MRLTPDQEREQSWDIPLVVGMILFVAVWVFMLIDVPTTIVAREPTWVTVQAMDSPPSPPPVPFPRPLALTPGQAAAK